MTDGLVVVIGGSAGSVSSIIELAKALPSGFEAPVCVTIHISPMTRSVLPNILQGASRLAASHAIDGDPLHPGHIFVAPPDWHLIVSPNKVHLSRGARENRHRPAIDVLFRSAATAHGRRVIAVLLSGFLDDGTAGLIAVKRMGGTVIIQNPNDTPYPDMPRNALEFVKPDFLLPISKIADTLTQLVAQGVEETATRKSASANPSSGKSKERILLAGHELSEELEMLSLDSGTPTEKMPGKLSAFACPDCRGALWEIEDGQLLRYRCHEGHAYSPQSLLSSKSDELEDALWSALRALDEKAKFSSRLLERAQSLGQYLVYDKFKTQAELAQKHANQIRQLLKDGQSGALQSAQKLKQRELDSEAEY